MSNETGTLLISLDFELMWGMFDKVDADSYGERLTGVHTVVPKLLDLFASYELHATWAAVGLLLARDQEMALAYAPNEQPEYVRAGLSAYLHLKTHQTEIRTMPQLYFAPNLVRQILDTPGQELASHTFAHYYCTEPQRSDEYAKTAFAADCAATTAIMQTIGTHPTSLVFPRNQVHEEALSIAATHGIRSYRGNEDSRLYRHGTKSPLPIRALRLLDHYCNLTGHHTYPRSAVSTTAGVVNLPASRFLRPYTKALAPLEPLRLRRIKRAMTHAAKHGEVFHLWWHPHNFGSNQDANLRMLTTIAEHYTTLKQQYGMESKTMAELTEAISYAHSPQS